MTTHSDSDKWLRQSLRAAAEAASPPASPHPIDEEDLLLDWCEGALPPEALAELHAHLARCPRCRQEVAAMVRAGALPLPGLEDEEAVGSVSEGDSPVFAAERLVEGAKVSLSRENGDSPPPSSQSKIKNQESKKSKMAWPRLAVAATVLIALGGLTWMLYSPAPGPGAQLARAERLLAEDRAPEALDLAERLWDGGLGGKDRQEAARILAEAGGAKARADLARADFAAVLETEDRVARRAGRTPGLASARLQAQRGMPAANALEQAGSLTDYGYELDASSPTKSLPILDETTERLDAEFRAALDEFPDSVELLLNRGQFLLELSRYDEAHAVFARALALDEHSPAARLGLGLAAFELGRADEALEHFEAAATLDPQDPQAELNAAVALVELGRGEEARQRFRRVRQRTTDPVMQARIDAELKP